MNNTALPPFASRNFLPLLLFGALLTGCRSERAAFSFHPEAQITSCAELNTQAQQADSITIAPLVVARALHPAQPKQPGQVVLTRQVLPQRQFLRGAVARGATGISTKASRFLRAQARASPQRVKPTDVAFYLGICCMVAGIVCLIAAISLLSGWLTLAGLVLTITGIGLFYHGMWNHGHWSFG